MPERPIRLPSAVIAGILSLVALLLRLPGLVSKPYWIAEVQELAYAYRGGFLDHPLFAAGDLPGYLYHSLCHLVGLEPTAAVTRLPALLLASLLPGLVYLLLNRRGEGTIGITAGLLWAVSLPAVQAGQEARLYIGVAFFLTVGLLVQFAAPQPSRRSVILLALCDAAALAFHPYAAFWLLIRWLGVLASSAAWRTWLRSTRVLPYLPLPGAVLGLQALLVATAAGQFRALHEHFSLQPYPLDFPFYVELIGHLCWGSGIWLWLAALALVAGLYLWSLRARSEALLLALYALAAPTAVLLGIHLAGSRFGFVHMLPAALPIYLLIAKAVQGMFDLGNQRGIKHAAVALLLVVLVRAGWLDHRYHRRGTRLEMGSDIAGVCHDLAGPAGLVQPGDLVVTTYDKYFTLFAWYCGPILPDSVHIAADAVPDNEFARAFNHLEADGGQGPLSQHRVVSLDEAAFPVAGASLYLIVPYFEDIEGAYSESIGWYGGQSPYGPQIGPDDKVLEGWEVTTRPLVKLLRRRVDKADTIMDLRRAVRRVQEAKRSWF